jgi:GntR family transcriptional regulator/MocR family aminotransferase
VLTEAPDQTFGYAEPLGSRELRESLAQYIGRSRAVATDADGISMFGGVTASFGFLGEAFRSLGVSRIAIEDPSLFLLRDVWAIVGLDVVPVPVDDDGLCVAELDGLDVGAVVVTPSHQFPTGTTMSPERRSQLIDWARSHGTWIVEDDYDGEFRYDRRPIGALQGLDPDRVIYAGTVSKTLSPGLRMSWLAVPPALRSTLAAVKHLRGGVSTIEQLALADFMDRGDLDRHLRQARSTYLARQRALTAVLADHADWLSCSPSQAGLHLSATIMDDSIIEARLISDAREHGVGLLGFGPLWTGEPTSQGIVLGYSRPAAHQFPAALDRLDGFLQTVS